MCQLNIILFDTKFGNFLRIMISAGGILAPVLCLDLEKITAKMTRKLRQRNCLLVCPSPVALEPSFHFAKFVSARGPKSLLENRAIGKANYSRSVKT